MNKQDMKRTERLGQRLEEGSAFSLCSVTLHSTEGFTVYCDNFVLLLFTAYVWCDSDVTIYTVLRLRHDLHLDSMQEGKLSFVSLLYFKIYKNVIIVNFFMHNDL